MDVAIEFTGSAFRHRISEADIRNALKTKIHAATMQEFPEKYGVIGFDRAGNPLEVMYNQIDDEHILIFHAMKLRESFKKQLGLQETIMARMTEEEAWALDELVTRTDITLGPNGSDWLSRREARITGMNDESAAWLCVKAERAHTSVGQIINELVREKIAASQ